MVAKEALPLGRAMRLSDLEDVARRRADGRARSRGARRGATRAGGSIEDLERAESPRHVPRRGLPRVVYGVNTGFGGPLGGAHLPGRRSHAAAQPPAQPRMRRRTGSRAGGRARDDRAAGPGPRARGIRACATCSSTTFVFCSTETSCRGSLRKDRSASVRRSGAARAPRAGPHRRRRGDRRDRAPFGKEALARAGIEPLVLEAKEGLALINGTQVHGGARSPCPARSRAPGEDSPTWAGAMSLEALKGSQRPFERTAHGAAPAPRAGRERVEPAAHAHRKRDHGEPPRMRESGKMPIRSGACRRCTARPATRSPGHRAWCSGELNSVTDNPLVFPADAAHPEPDLISGW